MKPTNANQRFLETTRGQIVQLLRQGPCTVNDLAGALDLTDNAIRSHLATLERDGLVRQAGERRGVRKPEYLYGLTHAAEQLFPKAYGVLLKELLDVLGERLPPEALEQILHETGQRLAAAHRAAVPGPSLPERLEQALQVLQGMGGLAELQEENGTVIIRGYSCPLAAAVDGHPEVCGLAATLLSELIGAPVRQQCAHAATPACAFVVAS